MNVERFLASLNAVLPDRYPKDGDGLHGGAWTAWMADHLHEVARRNDLRCCCHQGAADTDHAGGYRREYLFDFTWYRTWVAYELPVVAIEHENVWKKEAFLLDAWKLMMSAAPLRVMFGYARRAAELDAYVEALREAARSGQWRYPSQSEDVLLLGHASMGPREFRVIVRRAASDRWEEGDLLESWSSPPPS
jgi:hypothetical protein